MAKEFICLTCLDIANNAVETSCCHNIFCEECLSTKIGSGCPKCREPFQIQISHIARRVIGNMPAKCQFLKCKEKLTRASLKEHERVCQHRMFMCAAPDCNFKGVRRDYSNHLLVAHQDQIIENSYRCFEIEGTVGEQNEDIIVKKRNDAGRDCRLGSTGKFYCQGNMNEVYRCKCCNGSCGPTNGCNCISCMKLDIACRKLPSNWFVNPDGAVCRKSNETDKFYCGRKVIDKSRQCDGYCGPTNGPNCEACQRIQLQHDSRYDGIW